MTDHPVSKEAVSDVTTTAQGTLTVAQILQALEAHKGPFPTMVVRQAIKQRDVVAPELVRVLEAVAENPAKFALREDYMLHLFAIYLLAQFREKRAYRPIVRIVRARGDVPLQLLGDVLTEGLDRILCSVYNGDSGPLKQLVEDEKVDEYARWGALDAFVLLVKSGQMERGEAVDFFRALFEGKLVRTPSSVWDGLVSCVVRLPAPELMDLMREALAEELTGPYGSSLADVEAELEDGEVNRNRSAFITDTVAEMKQWGSFRSEPQVQMEISPAGMSERTQPRTSQLRSSNPLLVPLAPDLWSNVPPRSRPNLHVKAGPNKSCPCGSGKKYKKCCGAV